MRVRVRLDHDGQAAWVADTALADGLTRLRPRYQRGTYETASFAGGHYRRDTDRQIHGGGDCGLVGFRACAGFTDAVLSALDGFADRTRDGVSIVGTRHSDHSGLGRGSRAVFCDRLLFGSRSMDVRTGAGDRSCGLAYHLAARRRRRDSYNGGIYPRQRFW